MIFWLNLNLIWILIYDFLVVDDCVWVDRFIKVLIWKGMIMIEIFFVIKIEYSYDLSYYRILMGKFDYIEILKLNVL